MAKWVLCSERTQSDARSVVSWLDNLPSLDGSVRITESAK